MDAGWGLSRDVIKGGCVGKHGMGVKFRRDGMVSRKEGPPEGFWGVVEGFTKLTSPPGEMFSFYDERDYNRLCGG